MSTDMYDLGHIASGIDRIERARRTIARRRFAWNAKPGWNWKAGEEGMAHPKVVGSFGQAVLDYSDDGRRFQVNGYTYDGHHLYRREFATLDAALRNGSRVADDGPTPVEHAEAWNLTYPEGMWVRYWTGAREGVGRTGRTRSAATVLEGHTAVVWVTGHGACIALTHVQPVPGRDGVCIDVSEAIRRLEAQGWDVVIGEEGLELVNGKLTEAVPYRDSLTSLVDRGDVDDAAWRLRRAQGNRKRTGAV